MSARGSAPPGPARSKVRRLATVRHVGDESTYLYRLIETIGAGPDLETILRGVVLLVTEATDCHACLVWFVQEGRLVLRSASPPYAHLDGSVSMALDEGLAGWVVKTRRSAFIERDALADPRVKYFPELDEERYQSLVSVPILSRSDEVIGVIALQAVAPHEFERPDLDLLEHTASLIGGAVENARLYEDATTRVALLSELSRLSQAIASSGSEAEVLEVVTGGVQELLSADRVEIHLTDDAGSLHLASARPDRSRPARSVRPIAAAWILELDAVDSARERGRLAARRLWPEDPGGRTVVEPLVTGTERLGLLVASVPEGAMGAEAALASIAAHTAVAIRQHRAIDRLTEENLLKDLFRSLARPDAPAEATRELAERLGCDLDRPHLVVHVVGRLSSRRADPGDGGADPARGGRRSTWSDTARQVRARLLDRFPGVLMDDLERSLRALVPCGDRSPGEIVELVREIDWTTLGGGLSVGVSDPCSGASTFARGFEESESAAEVGGLLRGTPGVTTYEELGPYRYVLGAQDDDRDAIQRRLERLADYDERRGTRLLDTLEGYLDHRGSVVGTSRHLYIHANTLRQRLDRAQRLSGIDLERDDWLSLAVATKVVKLRRMRRAARPEGETHG